MTGRYGLNPDCTGRPSPQQSPGGGLFVVGGFCDNAEAWVFTETNSGTQDWLIGPLGISGTCSTKGLWVHGAASAKPVLQANTNDFAVGLKTCLRQNGTLTLNTTGDGEGHVITLDAGIYDTGKLVIAGKGKVVCNATLQVTQSGTVALGGNLTLADGSVLDFNFTEKKPAPVLDVTDKAVTLGSKSNIVVRVTADEGRRAKGGVSELTKGGKFANANVSLADGAPKLALRVRVVNGNIVLVCPSGTSIIVR